MPLTDILQNAVTREASDVLVVAGLPVDYKINGRLCREGEKLFPAQTLALTQELYSLAGRDMTKLLDTGDDDFSFAVSGLSRFRVNALRQRGPWPWSSGWCPSTCPTGTPWASRTT